MEQKLKDIIIDFNCTYISIPDNCMENIYNLFINDIIFKPTQAIEYYYMGVYYHKKKQYALMKMYYLTAITLEDSYAMNNLGFYYRYEKVNYDKMKKYYLMAIERENDFAMNNLGHYYDRIEKDYEKAEKYYLMSIKRNNLQAINNIAFHYGETREYDKMEKYYKMAFEKGNLLALQYLYNYYQKNDIKLRLLNLQIDYPDANHKIKIVNNIKAIIKNKIDINKKFAELLIKFGIMSENKVFNGNSILLNCIKNSMIVS